MEMSEIPKFSSYVTTAKYVTIKDDTKGDFKDNWEIGELTVAGKFNWRRMRSLIEQNINKPVLLYVVTNNKVTLDTKSGVTTETEPSRVSIGFDGAYYRRNKNKENDNNE